MRSACRQLFSRLQRRHNSTITPSNDTPNTKHIPTIQLDVKTGATPINFGLRKHKYPTNNPGLKSPPAPYRGPDLEALRRAQSAHSAPRVDDTRREALSNSTRFAPRTKPWTARSPSERLSASQRQAAPRNNRKRRRRPVQKSDDTQEGFELDEDAMFGYHDWSADVRNLDPRPLSTPDVSISSLDSGSGFFASPAEQVKRTLRNANLKAGKPGKERVTPQQILEELGGDYSAKVQISPPDFAKPFVKLGAVRHAQLVMSKNPGISAAAQKEALDIIASCTGQSV